MGNEKELWWKVGVKNAEGLKSLDAIGTKTENLTSSFKSMASAMGLAFGGMEVLNFIKSSVTAYAEQETAVNKLNTALKRNTDSLQAWAGEMQKITTYGDEVTISAQALVGSFIKSDDAIKKVMKASMDFATVQNMELLQATELITKAIVGEVNALGRYGISIDGAKGQTEKLDRIVGEINKKFGGQAQAELNTYAGKIENMGNKFGELQEKIGGIIVPSLEAFGDELDKAMESVDNFTGDVQGLGEGIAWYFKNIVMLVPTHIIRMFGWASEAFKWGKEQIFGKDFVMPDNTTKESDLEKNTLDFTELNKKITTEKKNQEEYAKRLKTLNDSSLESQIKEVKWSYEHSKTITQKVSLYKDLLDLLNQQANLMGKMPIRELSAVQDKIINKNGEYMYSRDPRSGIPSQLDKTTKYAKPKIDTSLWEDNMDVITKSFSDTFADEMTNAWKQFIGEADTLFDKLLDSMVSNMISKFASKASNWLLDSILDFISNGSTAKGIAKVVGGVDRPINLNIGNDLLETYYSNNYGKYYKNAKKARIL